MVKVMLWVVWAIIPLVGIVAAFTPYLMPKRECFAVTVPDAAQADPYLRKLKRIYLYLMLGIVALFSVASAAALLLSSNGVFLALLVVGIMAIMILSYGLMLYFRAKTTEYKTSQGWVSEKSRKISYVGDEEIPHPLSMKWCWIYVPIIVLVLLIGVLGYPSMPDMVAFHVDLQGNETDFHPKSFGLVLFPVGFCIFMAVVMTFVQWSIAHSKKASDPSSPAESLWAYGMFARAQSALCVFGGLALTASVGIMMQLAITGVLSLAQVVFPIMIVAIIMVIASIVISLVYGQSGSRLVSRMETSDEILRDNDRYWKLGIFYCNPNDASLFLPERFGIGWTVNFSRPAVWVIFGLFALLIVGFVAICLTIA